MPVQVEQGATGHRNVESTVGKVTILNGRVARTTAARNFASSNNYVKNVTGLSNQP